MDLGDGLNLLAQGPSQFESESVGRYLFYDAGAWLNGPLAIYSSRSQSGRRKESRPSLLDETILTEHTQGPKGPGTENPRHRREPIKPASPNRITTEQSENSRAKVTFKQVDSHDVAAASMPSTVEIESSSSGA